MEASIVAYDRASWKYEYQAVEFTLPDGWEVSNSSTSVKGFGVAIPDVETDGNIVRVGIRRQKKA